MNAESRFLFSYVPQGNTILSGTIAENLRMVRENATDEEIVETLKISCAWDVVSIMPDAIHAKIGERGRGFSEGRAHLTAAYFVPIPPFPAGVRRFFCPCTEKPPAAVFYSAAGGLFF